MSDRPGLLHDELHWLDVPERVFFKLAVTVYRCLNGGAPPYLTDYGIASRSPMLTLGGWWHLRSAEPTVIYSQYRVSGLTLTAAELLQLPALMVWNCLPDFIRGTRRSMQTLSDMYPKRICLLDTSASRALGVLDNNALQNSLSYIGAY